MSRRSGDQGPASGEKRKQKKTKKSGKSKRLKQAELDAMELTSNGPRQKKKKGFRRATKKSDLVYRSVRSYGATGWDKKRVENYLSGTVLTKAQAVDDILMQVHGEELLRRAKELLQGGENKTRVTKRQIGIVVTSGTEPVAVIAPTRAVVRARAKKGRKRFSGKFAVSGAHWLLVQEAIRKWIDAPVRVSAPKPQPAPRPRPVAQVAKPGKSKRLGIVTDADLLKSEGLFESTIESSNRIKFERQLALPYTCVLRSKHITLRLEPVVAKGRAPRVPFTYEVGEDSAVGEIYLKSPEDPIAVGIQIGTGLNRGSIWSAVLQGYADLTCPDEQFNPTSGQTGAGRHGAAATPRTGIGRPRSGSRRQTRKYRTDSSIFGSRLRPDGRTLSLMSSFVMGHKRLLDLGRQPSEEALKRASDLGIGLAPGETWVRPHIRGHPPDLELLFTWNFVSESA